MLVCVIPLKKVERSEFQIEDKLWTSATQDNRLPLGLLKFYADLHSPLKNGFSIVGSITCVVRYYSTVRHLWLGDGVACPLAISVVFFFCFLLGVCA